VIDKRMHDFLLNRGNTVVGFFPTWAQADAERERLGEPELHVYFQRIYMDVSEEIPDAPDHVALVRWGME
jgi:hypothetical protein